MTETKYQWLRFWGPEMGNSRLLAMAHLEDPLGPYGHLINPETKLFEELQSVHCLGLLGEPGTGKSEELKLQVSMIAESACASRNNELRYWTPVLNKINALLESAVS